MTREIIVDVLRGYDEVRSIGQIADELVQRLSVVATPAPSDHALGETETNFRLEWIAAARPPVHPKPMTGKAWFGTFERAVKHMKSQAADAQFVSITEHVTTVVKTDRSDDFRAALNKDEKHG